MSIRIEIHEQPERRRFWAEVEVGGMIARRREVTSPRDAGLAAILSVVQAAADEMIPQPKPDAPPDVVFAPPDLRDPLRRDAEALGIDVDRRWGEARLRAEIAAVGHESSPTSD